MKMKLTKAIGFAAWMSFSAVAVQAQSILYVDANATGAGNGTSWTNAYPFLQDALAETESSGGAISEIWVAAGTYKPDQGISLTAGDRQATFRLLDGVALYGGFEGGETELGQRDIAANVTILSGDLNGDDGPDFANYAENSYHVVTYDDPAATGVVIDGFTISGGNADGPDGLTNQGGGIHIRDGLVPCLPGGPTIRNCIVENNWAAHHGAINDHGLTTVIENCIVRNNFSGHEGGGLQIHSGAPTITNTRFESNVSDGEGGGAWAGSDNDPTCTGSSAPTFIDCHFSGNVAFHGGGGLFLRESHAILQRCAFDGNSSEYAAGMYIRNSSPTLFDCTFIGNSATRGGGIYSSESNPTLTNCTFSGNQAYATAGGIYNQNSNPTLANCLFDDNTADLHAGGMANLNNSN
jgi:predicted outer membrane repeat protein